MAYEIFWFVVGVTVGVVLERHLIKGYTASTSSRGEEDQG